MSAGKTQRISGKFTTLYILYRKTTSALLNLYGNNVKNLLAATNFENENWSKVVYTYGTGREPEGIYELRLTKDAME